MDLQINNNNLKGVLIYVKSSDLEDIKEGITINTWYTIIPDTLVHGGWIGAIVEYEYFLKLKESREFLTNITNDLKL
jgi:hypothetical protein